MCEKGSGPSAHLFRASGGIGIHGRLKICYSCGFESRLAYAMKTIVLGLFDVYDSVHIDGNINWKTHHRKEFNTNWLRSRWDERGLAVSYPFESVILAGRAQSGNWFTTVEMALLYCDSVILDITGYNRFGRYISRCFTREVERVMDNPVWASKARFYWDGNWIDKHEGYYHVTGRQLTNV